MANTGIRTGPPQQDICQVELVIRKLTGKTSTRNMIIALASVTTEIRGRIARHLIPLQLQRLNATTVIGRGITQTIVPIQSWTNHQRLTKLISLPRKRPCVDVNSAALMQPLPNLQKPEVALGIFE